MIHVKRFLAGLSIFTMFGTVLYALSFIEDIANIVLGCMVISFVFFIFGCFLYAFGMCVFPEETKTQEGGYSFYKKSIDTENEEE